MFSADEEKERARLKRAHPGEDDIVSNQCLFGSPLAVITLKVICKKTYEVERTPHSWIDYPQFWLGKLGKEMRLSACYVKGRLQPTRSFGDFYLKLKEFAYDFESNG